MKRSLGLVLLGLLALIAWKPGDHWYAYKASDNSYTVNFPGKPDEKSNSSPSAAGPIKYVLVSYSTNAGKRAYLSSSTMYNVSPSKFNVQKGLDGARNGAASSTKATVSRETKISFKGAPGREFYMTMPNGTKAKERIFIVNKGKGPVLYQVLVVDTEGKIEDPDTDTFLKSLQIKKL